MKYSRLISITLLLVILCGFNAYSAKESIYYFNPRETTFETGKDNGYYEKNIIDEDDPHWNWDLGEFFVEGFTESTLNDDTVVFIKSPKDTVTLGYKLKQDVNNLNNKSSLSIYSDTNGYDKHFQYIPEEGQLFGQGTLLIRYTDYQNVVHDIPPFFNFLTANASLNANTSVTQLQEGDYEVALDYEIFNDPRNILGLSIVPSYHNYRTSFKFSVRNGNSMVYTHDISSGKELYDGDITTTGFYVDLANSQYLNINVKKQILRYGADGLTEDTRFNRPAKDGEKFVETGIYTITAENTYTKKTTEKRIFVGTDTIMKCHFLTDKPIKQIREELAMGGVIQEDGSIIYPVPETTAATEATTSATESTTIPESTSAPTTTPTDKTTSSPTSTTVATEKTQETNSYFPIILIVVILGLIGIILNLKRKMIDGSNDKKEDDK